MMSSMSPTGVTVRRTCSPPESSSSGGQKTAEGQRWRSQKKRKNSNNCKKMVKSRTQWEMRMWGGWGGSWGGLWFPQWEMWVGVQVGLFGNTGLRQRPAYPGQRCRKRHCLSRSRCQPVRLPELWQSSFQEAAGPGGHPQIWHIAGGTHTALWPPEGSTE